LFFRLLGQAGQWHIPVSDVWKGE